MSDSFLEAAFLALNLAHGLNMDLIARLPQSMRERAIKRENQDYLDAMATVGCSSLAFCRAPTVEGACGTVVEPDGARILPDGVAVDLGGERWNAQNGDVAGGEALNSIKLRSDRALSISVKTGERPWFDPARKLRAEICGRSRAPKDAKIHVRFRVKLETDSFLQKLDWAIIAQIHQADSHYEDKTQVEASPVLALSLLTQGDGERLLVTGESVDRPMRRQELDPSTGQQRWGASGPVWINQFAPRREIGRTAAFSRGEWHEIELIFSDGHGGPGMVFARLDDNILANENHIPTGYSYVDDLQDVRFAGGAQLTGSYAKLGFYGGVVEGEPDARTHVSLTYRDVSLSIDPPGR
jgi:hypothetical protein